MRLTKKDHFTIILSLHYASEWAESIVGSFKGCESDPMFKKIADSSREDKKNFLLLRQKMRKNYGLDTNDT